MTSLLGLVLGITLLASPSVAMARQDLPIGSTAVVSGTSGQGLRVRLGPGISYRIVTVLPEGTSVPILAGPIFDGTDDWYQIGVGGNATGWSIQRYLSPAAPPASSTGAGGERTFVAKTTAYADGVGGIPLNARTASGRPTRWGVVAVDPRVIPLGSRLAIEGFDGVFVAEDIHGMRGSAVDVWLPDAAAAKAYGIQLRRIRILSEGPPR